MPKTHPLSSEPTEFLTALVITSMKTLAIISEKIASLTCIISTYTAESALQHTQYVTNSVNN